VRYVVEVTKGLGKFQGCCFMAADCSEEAQRLRDEAARLRLRRPRYFLVQSMEHSRPGSSWPPEPPEFWHDIAYVRAMTKNRARVLAVRWWRRMHGKPYTYETISCGENPFREMKVFELDERCEKCGRLEIEHTTDQYVHCKDIDAGWDE
jgi:hypothetical protein